jgi:hypothetical protein
MSIFGYSKTLLLTKNFVYIEKKYGVILNQKILFYERNFFIFFAEKYLGVFSVTYIWRFLVTIKHQKTSPNFSANHVTLYAVKKVIGIDIL